MSALTIQFESGGVFLPRLGLWLDPGARQTGPEKAFISHAHADHIGAHREVILSAATARLMRARLGGKRVEHILPFGESRWFAGGEIPYRLTLLPAGHILGSAMAFIEAETETLLYTGDFSLRPSHCAGSCAPCRADVLIMETTFGQPRYQFPPAEEVLREVIDFCRAALAQEETPVLMSYSLGKSQELLCGLADARLPVVVHETVHKINKIYEQFGHCFPSYERYERRATQGKVMICPPQGHDSAALRGRARTRTAILTGWAVEAGCRFRFQTDAAFPLSDHADFPGLIEMVKRVAPKRVFTLHGFAAEFAQALRDSGCDARALGLAEQLPLALA